MLLVLLFEYCHHEIKPLSKNVVILKDHNFQHGDICRRKNSQLKWESRIWIRSTNMTHSVFYPERTNKNKQTKQTNKKRRIYVDITHCWIIWKQYKHPPVLDQIIMVHLRRWQFIALKISEDAFYLERPLRCSNMKVRHAGSVQSAASGASRFIKENWYLFLIE